MRSLSQKIGLILGPVAFLLIALFVDLDPTNSSVTFMAAIAVLMAVWWITEAIPLAATSLLPLILYPLFGILSGKETAPVYMNYIVFLFIGGMLIAQAMEKTGLHRRIAIGIVRMIGGSPSRLVLSFMIATAFLSMWISNTATSVMMLAIGLAMIAELESNFGKKDSHKLAVALLLGIAYSASIGGMATLVGTPTNLTLVRIFEISFPDAPEISFAQWMLLGIPLAFIMLSIVWLLLTQVFFRIPKSQTLSREVIDREHAALGPIRREEVAVMITFSLTAVLWIFRKDLTIGDFSMKGWSGGLPFGDLIDDGTIAVAMAVVLFFVPGAKNEAGIRRPILTVASIGKVPWHIILLFGGGFALAKGMGESGLSAHIASGFSELQNVPPLAMILVSCLLLTFLTELTSNTATTEMILPLLASIGVAMETHPLLLMIPACLSASCAFMMPVATPPNAIVFGSGRIKIGEMVRVGIFLNLIGVVVISLLFYYMGQAIFDIDPSVKPEWAVPPK